MKKIIAVLFIITTTLLGCGALSYDEGKLYSEKNLEGYNGQGGEEFQSKGINRADVIDKVFYIVKKGFGIEIDRKEAHEEVRLGKINDKFQWNIDLRDKNNSFYFGVNSETGEIIELINYDKYLDRNSIQVSLSEEEARTLITPLAEAMGIDLNNYNMRIEISNEIYIYLYNEEELNSIFIISKYGEKIISYTNVRELNLYKSRGKNEDFNN